MPPSLLPFAMDWGDHYFCVNASDGKVYYLLREDMLAWEVRWGEVMDRSVFRSRKLFEKIGIGMD